jgi:hypothetical protein
LIYWQCGYNMKYYYGNCVSFPDPVEDLCAMVESGVQITRRTFLKHVHRGNLKAIEASLGYPMGRLTMASDWAVSYFKGTLCGREVVWFSHSSIEYVFK